MVYLILRNQGPSSTWCTSSCEGLQYCWCDGENVLRTTLYVVFERVSIVSLSHHKSLICTTRKSLEHQRSIAHSKILRNLTRASRSNTGTARAIAIGCNLIQRNTHLESRMMMDGKTKSRIVDENGKIVGMEGPLFREICWDPVRKKLRTYKREKVSDQTRHGVQRCGQTLPQLRLGKM